MCPDVKNIQILRNALYEPDLNATNFVMVVNDCEVAEQTTKDENLGDLTPYTGAVCHDDEQERYDRVTNITLKTMVVGNYFNFYSDGLY